MTRNLQQLSAADRGSVATEYALLAGLIAVVIVAAVALLGRTVLDLFMSVPAAL